MIPKERRRLDRELYNALMKTDAKKAIKEHIREIKAYEEFQRRAKAANKQARLKHATATKGVPA